MGKPSLIERIGEAAREYRDALSRIEAGEYVSEKRLAKLEHVRDVLWRRRQRQLALPLRRSQLTRAQQYALDNGRRGQDGTAAYRLPVHRAAK